MPAYSTEQTPLLSRAVWAFDGRPFDREVLCTLMSSQSMTTLFLSLSTIVFSVGLINFNNYLMEDRFPYAVTLVITQMAFGTSISFTLFSLWPSLFPSLTRKEDKVIIDQEFLIWGALPIGALFATSLVFSNLAYAHLSVAFLQMMKEANICIVYVLSLLAALEVFSWRHVQVIAFAIFAASLTIKGELAFEMTGFMIQMVGGFCECGRIVLQSILLSGKKVDALSYVLIISPICLALLLVILCLLALLPQGVAGPGLQVPSAELVWAWSPVLLANCVVAFALNVHIALLIKNTSPTTYMFVGILKDIIAIVVSVVVLKDLVSSLQVVSFTLQIGSVVVWSLLKLHPEKFERGLLAGLLAVLMGKAAGDAESFEMRGPKDAMLPAMIKSGRACSGYSEEGTPSTRSEVDGAFYKDV